jgi:hypothetical protein
MARLRRRYRALARRRRAALRCAGTAQRLGVIGDQLRGSPTGTMLSTGCETKIHLLELSKGFERLMGTDP